MHQRKLDPASPDKAASFGASQATTSLLFPACFQLYNKPHIPSNTAIMFGSTIFSSVAIAIDCLWRLNDSQNVAYESDTLTNTKRG